MGISLLIIIDVNECEAGTHTCDENAECTNTEGSFDCACRSSYFGDGFIACLCEINNSDNICYYSFIIKLIAVMIIPTIDRQSVQGNRFDHKNNPMFYI